MEANHNKGQAPFKISGNWAEQCKQLQSKHAELTDADLKFETGKENELLTRLENRLDKNREDVINIIENCQSA